MKCLGVWINIELLWCKILYLQNPVWTASCGPHISAPYIFKEILTHTCIHIKEIPLIILFFLTFLLKIASGMFLINSQYHYSSVMRGPKWKEEALLWRWSLLFRVPFCFSLWKVLMFEVPVGFIAGCQYFVHCFGISNYARKSMDAWM